MTDKGIYKSFLENKASGIKSLAVLLDPDKWKTAELRQAVELSEKADVDYFFVGSSAMMGDGFHAFVALLKKSPIPVILFPGNRFQISDKADAILLLSLISGRNPELLIGQHVLAAPELKRSGLEIIPTGYMLIDGGNLTSVNYISQTLPIPANKWDIAVSTAMAGEMLGMKLIYLEAGSGAKKPVGGEMIRAVRENADLPLIVGGGIRDAGTAVDICRAGADIIVIGNGFEEDVSLIFEIADAVHKAEQSQYLRMHPGIVT